MNSKNYKWVVEVVAEVSNIIRDAGSISKQSLRNQLGSVLTLNVCDKIVLLLQRSDLVKDENGMLTWIGSKKGA